MSKHRKIISFDPTVHFKHLLKNPEFKTAYDALEDEFKQASVVTPVHRMPGSAKDEVLYIAEDFDAPLGDFAD